jgi:uncharacterized delta-60 repeat protein
MNKFFTHYVCSVFFFLISISTYAQPGTFDLNYYNSQGAENTVATGVALNDGSVILGGRFLAFNHSMVNGMVKLNPDGTVNNSFNVGSGFNNVVNTIVLQNDGKIIVAGDFTSVNGLSYSRIARLNPNGSVDTSFRTITGFDGVIYCLKLQPNGKILVGGLFSNYDGFASSCVARLNSNGSFDPTFNVGSGLNDAVFSINLQNDSKVILAGTFTIYNGGTANSLCRVDSVGAIDGTFNSNAGANGIVTASELQTDGKVIMAGYFTAYDGNPTNRIVRVNTDGSYDNTYSVGTGINNNVNELIIQPDNKVIAVGGFTTFNGTTANRVVRVNTNGSIDAGFVTGSGLNLSANTVFQDNLGKTYIGGTFTTVNTYSRNKVVRLNTNGNVDQTFLFKSTFNGDVNQAAVQSTGKLIVVGAFTKFDTTIVGRIMRMSYDGSIDTSFRVGVGANNVVTSVVVLPDDRIVVAGSFTSFAGVATNRIVMLNPDGTRNTGFVIGTGLNNTVEELALQSDGKILAGGNFTTYAGATTNRIVRLLQNGTRDTTFAIGTGFNGIVHKIVQQTDKKLLIGGAFAQYKGSTVNRIVRIDTLGTVDNTFVTGTGANSTVYAIAEQTDGKILIGGLFTTFNGASKNRVCRLSNTGTIDATYTADANARVSDIILLPGNFALLGGFFTQYNTAPYNGYVITDPTGQPDLSTYYNGSGTFGNIFSLTRDLNNRSVYINGSFGACQGYFSNRLARLNFSTINLLPPPSTSFCLGQTVTLDFIKDLQFIGNNVFTLELSEPNGSFATTTTLATRASFGSGNDTVSFTLPYSLPVGGEYRIRIRSSNPVDTSNSLAGISIYPLPSPTITASGPTTFCQGNNVTLNAPAGFLYQWGVTSDTTQSTIASSSGNYFVNVTNSLGCRAISNSIFVTVNPGPDSSIQVSAITLCAGGTVTLSGVPGLTYNWGGGQTTQSITVNSNGNYSLTVSNGNCVSDSTRFIDIAAITSNLISANGSTTACFGNSVSLTSQPGLTYNWSNGAQTQSTSASTSGSYSVTVSDGTCSATSQNLNVVIAPRVFGTFNGSDTLSSLNICTSTLLLHANDNGLSYSWSTGETTQNITVSTSQTVQLTVTDANNCSASSSLALSFNPVNATITPSGNTTICEGQSVTLSASGGTGYFWSNNSTSASITVSTSGTYTVTVVASANCTVASAPLTVTVNPKPVATIAITGSASNASYNVLDAGPDNAASYVWQTNNSGSYETFNTTTTDRDTVSCIGFQIIVVNPGAQVRVIVTDANGCTDTSAARPVTFCVTDVQDIEETTLAVFPNPATSYIQVNAGEIFDEYVIADILGNVVYKYRNTDSSASVRLDVGSLAQGTYFITAGKAKAKFIKTE